MVWVQVFIAVALFVVGTLLRKGPDVNPAAFEDFGFPDVDPTRRIPVIWGKKRVKSLHCMEVQGYRTKKIKKGNFIKKETVGFKYFSTVAMGICFGPSVTVTKIYLGDKVLWEGTATPSDSGFAINISDGDFHGPDDGVSGTIRIYPGSSSQTVNAVLAAEHAALGGAPAFPDIPYRGLCYAVFEDFYWGNTPTIRQLEFVVERYPNTLSIGAGRQINTTANESPSEGAVDLAIPEIVSEILTNDDWGLAESVIQDLDTTTFTDAATTLSTEANAMSLIWQEGDSIRELLQTIMKQADGFVFKRMSTGLWEMNLARDAYLSGSPVLSEAILSFDETNCNLQRYSRGSWDETYNMVDVKWQNRNIKGRPPSAHAQDMANFTIQGVINQTEFAFPGCHSATLAQFLASRQLKALSIPLATAEITTNRLAFDLVPGDMVEFKYDKLGITRIFMRINSINLGTPEQGEIRISLIQDVFGVADTFFSVPQSTLAVGQNPDPAQVANAWMEDMPRFLATFDADNPSFNEKPMILAQAPQGNALEYIPHAKLAAASAYIEQDVSWSYAARGTLQANLDPEDGDIVSLVVENVNDTSDIEATVSTTDQKGLAEGMIMVVGTGSPSTAEPELMTYGNASISGSTVTLTNVNRAVEDTVPLRLKAGDEVWFVSGTVGTTVDVYGDADTVDVKLQNIATTGDTDISGATNEGPLTFRRRMDRPIIPGEFKVGSSNNSPRLIRYPGNFIFPPGDLLFSWNRRNRLRTALDFQADADAPESANTLVEVDIYSLPSMTFLRTLTVESPNNAATYTKAQQIADGVHNKYWVNVRAWYTNESPNLGSISVIRQRFRRNPAISPTPSPQGTFPTSPLSPRYRSPQISPLSPIHSPLSPVPSPTSPFPFPSPLSPFALNSPLPSPISFAAAVRSISGSPEAPEHWYTFDEPGGYVEDYGYGNNRVVDNTGNPGFYGKRNVPGRDGRHGAVEMAAIGSPGAPSMVTTSNFTTAADGTVFWAMKVPTTIKRAQEADPIWGKGISLPYIQARWSTRGSGGGGSPGPSPQGKWLEISYGQSSGNQITIDYDLNTLADNQWHTFALRRYDGVSSPGLMDLFVDGVKATVASVNTAGAPDRDMWFAQIASQTMRFGSISFPGGHGTFMDEWVLWDRQLSDAEIGFLHAAYANELGVTKSPIHPILDPRVFSPGPSPLPSPLTRTYLELVQQAAPVFEYRFDSQSPEVLQNYGSAGTAYNMAPHHPNGNTVSRVNFVVGGDASDVTGGGAVDFPTSPVKAVLRDQHNVNSPNAWWHRGVGGTMGIWVKTGQQTAGDIQFFSSVGTGGFDAIFFGMNAGNPFVDFFDTASVRSRVATTGIDIRDDRWHFIVVRQHLDGRGLSMFIDGVQTASGSRTGSSLNNWFTTYQQSQVYIGFGGYFSTAGNTIQEYIGEIGHFFVSDEILDHREIYQMYKAYWGTRPSPHISPRPSPSSPVPSPISPVQSPISPVTSPISPVSSPISPVPSPSFLGNKATYTGYILDQAPVLYWPLEDAPSNGSDSPAQQTASPVIPTTAVERIAALNTVSVGSASPGNHPITRDNQYSWGSIRDNSISSPGYLEADDHASLDLADTWSIELWIQCGQQFDNGGDQARVLSRSGSFNITVWDENGASPGSGGVVRVGIFEPSPTTNMYSLSRVDDGHPHHICITQDVSGGDSPARLYIDGVLETVAAIPHGKPAANANTLRILGDGTESFQGQVGHVAIYNKTLTPDEVLQHYQEGVRWSPFYAQSMKLAPDNWWRLWDAKLDESDVDRVSDWLGTDHGTAKFGPSQVRDATTLKNDGPLVNQPSRGMRMNDDVGSPSTGMVALPDDMQSQYSPLIESGAFATWYRPPPAGSPDASFRWMFCIYGATTQMGFALDSSNRIFCRFNAGSGNFTDTFLDASLTPTDGNWHHLAWVADGVNPIKVYVDGIRIDDGNITVQTNGTSAAEWWFDDVFAVAATGYLWTLGGLRQPTGSPVNTAQNFPGDMAESMFWVNRTITDKDVLDLYASGIANYPSLTETMAELMPEVLLELSDKDASLVDQMNGMNGNDGVFNGTFRDEMQPMAADDPTPSVWFDRASATQYVAFAQSFLQDESAVTSPLGNMPKAWSHMITLMHEEQIAAANSDNMIPWANNNAANTGLNAFLEIKGNGIRMDAFQPGNKWLASKSGTLRPGHSRLLTYIQKANVYGSFQSPQDGTWRRMFFDREGEALYSTEAVGSPLNSSNNPNYIERYFSTGVMDSARIGEWEGAAGANNRGFGGIIGHMSFWLRTLADREESYVGHRKMGFVDFQLEVMQYRPFLYWRCNEPATPDRVVDHSGNNREPTIFGSSVFDDPNFNNNLWNTDEGVVNLNEGLMKYSQSGDIINPGTTSLTYGGWIRIPTESPLNSVLGQLALYDNSNTTSYFQTLIQAQSPKIEHNVVFDEGGNAFTGAAVLTPGTWYFIVTSFDAVTDTVIVTVNGEEEINQVLGSPGDNNPFDSFAVNSREFTSPTVNNVQDAMYHDVFLIAGTALTTAQVRRMYARSFAPTYDQLVKDFGASAYWKMNEANPDQTGAGRFLNTIKDSDGHYTVAIPTVSGSPPSPQFAAPTIGTSIIPAYPDNAALFTYGGVDTGWRGYQKGGAQFSVAWWMQDNPGTSPTSWEGGAVWSLGAETLDTSPDEGARLTCEIENLSPKVLRLTMSGGNTIDWTLPLDGLAHHYVVVFPTTDGNITDFLLYVDGVQQVVNTTVTPESPADPVNFPDRSPLADPVRPFMIGNFITLASLPLQNTRLARLAYFPAALTLRQVRTLYTAGSGTQVESP